MNALIIYWSKTGNTEKVALAIREGLEEAGADVRLTRVEDAADVDLYAHDLVCVGFPSYRWRPPKPMDDFLNRAFTAYRKQGRVRIGAPRLPGKHALVFCTYSGPHTGIREAVPAGLYAGQFFEHLGFTVLDEWYVVGEYHGSEEASTQGTLGDIRGRPNNEDLSKVKQAATQLAEGMTDMNFWQGKKVRLRAVEPSDAEYFISWNLDSERARHLDFVWPPTSEASVRTWVEEESKRKLEHDAFRWMIENQDGEPVGGISTHDCNPRDGTFSYGVDVVPEHQREGYASEAICLVLKYYFQELRYQKVTVPVHADNPASIRLHERLGFQREGTLRRMFFTQGHFVDEIWFGMTAEEFQNTQDG